MIQAPFWEWWTLHWSSKLCNFQLASLYTDVLKLDCWGDTNDKASRVPKALLLALAAPLQQIVLRGWGWSWENVFFFKEEEVGEHESSRVSLQMSGEQCETPDQEMEWPWMNKGPSLLASMHRIGMGMRRALLTSLSTCLDFCVLPPSHRSFDRHSVFPLRFISYCQFLCVIRAPIKGKTHWKFMRADTACCDGSVGTAVVNYANMHQWTL